MNTASSVLSDFEKTRKEEREREFQERLRAHAGKQVPLRYREAETDNEEALRWVQDPHGVLYLYGPVGTGKSYMGWALAKRFIVRAHPCRFKGGSVATLLEEMKPGMIPEPDRGGWTDPKFVASRANLLFLDDFGAHQVTGWSLTTLFAILDERYNRLLPTIIASNLLPGDELKHLVGDRITSRLAHDVTVIPVLGEDRRLAS